MREIHSLNSHHWNISATASRCRRDLLLDRATGQASTSGPLAALPWEQIDPPNLAATVRAMTQSDPVKLAKIAEALDWRDLLTSEDVQFHADRDTDGNLRVVLRREELPTYTLQQLLDGRATMCPANLDQAPLGQVAGTAAFALEMALRELFKLGNRVRLTQAAIDGWNLTPKAAGNRWQELARLLNRRGSYHGPVSEVVQQTKLLAIAQAVRVEAQLRDLASGPARREEALDELRSSLQPHRFRDETEVLVAFSELRILSSEVQKFVIATSRHTSADKAVGVLPLWAVLELAGRCASGFSETAAVMQVQSDVPTPVEMERAFEDWAYRNSHRDRSFRGCLTNRG